MTVIGAVSDRAVPVPLRTAGCEFRLPALVFRLQLTPCPEDMPAVVSAVMVYEPGCGRTKLTRVTVPGAVVGGPRA
jgi:hypothetical protein